MALATRAVEIVRYQGSGGNISSRAADVDTTTGDAWHFSESTALIQNAGITNGTVYGGMNTTWNVPKVYAPNFWLGGTLEVRVIPDNGSDTALKGVVFWKQVDFLNGADTKRVSFSGGDTLSVNLTIISGVADIRFAVKQDDVWYISDTTRTSTGLFSIEPSAVTWWTVSMDGTYTIGGTASSVALNNVRAVGLYLQAARAAQQARITLDRFVADASAEGFLRLIILH
jgi:hypothetical protein